MVSSLRNRLALVVLLGAMIVPALSGNLRGLTHILVCEEEVARPFVVEILPDGGAVVASATTIGQGDALLCGGLEVDLRAQLDGSDLSLDVEISNTTDTPWVGTVGLEVETPDVDVVIPSSAGRVEPGDSSVSKLGLTLGEGITDISGTLLLGP